MADIGALIVQIGADASGLPWRADPEDVDGVTQPYSNPYWGNGVEKRKRGKTIK